MEAVDPQLMHTQTLRLRRPRSTRSRRVAARGDRRRLPRLARGARRAVRRRRARASAWRSARSALLRHRGCSRRARGAARRAATGRDAVLRAARRAAQRAAELVRERGARRERCDRADAALGRDGARGEGASCTLPRGYDPTPALPGALPAARRVRRSSATTLEDGIAAIVGDRPWIVVSANGGRAGSLHRLVRHGARARTAVPPAWETHHLRRAGPVRRRALPDAAPSAAAGRSWASRWAARATMKYAAARPDLFGAAVSLSGAVNTTLRATRSTPPSSQAVWLTTLDPASGPLAHCTWGDPVANQVVWRDNDPTYLAENLRGHRAADDQRRRQPGRAGRGGRELRHRRVDDVRDDEEALRGARRRGHRARRRLLRRRHAHVAVLGARAERCRSRGSTRGSAATAPAPEAFDFRSRARTVRRARLAVRAAAATRASSPTSTTSRRGGLTATGSGTLDVVTRRSPRAPPTGRPRPVAADDGAAAALHDRPRRRPTGPQQDG